MGGFTRGFGFGDGGGTVAPPVVPNLQDVTDVGNTTTNDLVVTDAGNTMRLHDSDIQRDIGSFQTTLNFTNPTANRTQTFQDASGTVALLENLPTSATAAGTNTYTATLSPAITAYASTLRVWILFTNGNTGASTLNLNGLGARTIVKNSNQALISGDITAGQILNLAYDGTNFQVVSALMVGGTLGNVLFVSASAPVSSNTQTRAQAIGRIDRPFQSLQSAVSQRLAGDCIIVYASTITENITLNAVNGDIIFINSTLNGTITNTFVNGVNFGQIVGIGNSTINGQITVQGGSWFSMIRDINLIGGCNLSLNYLNVNFTLSTPQVIFGVYKNCTITSSVNLTSTYSAPSGFTFDGCTITCLNFADSTGGLSSIGGNFIFKNTRVNCVNFIYTRGVSTFLFQNCIIKATGNSWFWYQDDVSLSFIQALNSTFETACTNLNQSTYSANSLVQAIGNKPITFVFGAGVYTLFPTLNII